MFQLFELTRYKTNLKSAIQSAVWAVARPLCSNWNCRFEGPGAACVPLNGSLGLRLGAWYGRDTLSQLAWADCSQRNFEGVNANETRNRSRCHRIGIFGDELGIVTIKGAQDDVQRTVAVLGKIQKARQDLVPDSITKKQDSSSDALPQVGLPPEVPPRPKSVDDVASSLTRFEMVQESKDSRPVVYSPLEAIEIVKRFANADHGKPIGVRFRVASVHPPFVAAGEEDLGHAKSELHLDFRPLPVDFAKDEFLVVLTHEAIDQLSRLGIEDLEKHFLVSWLQC